MSIASYFKERKTKKLKKKLKELYLKYHVNKDAFDCGATLIQYISPRLTRIEAEFDKTIAKLRVLDPKCPDFKLRKE